MPELPAVCTSLNQNGFLWETYLSGAAYKCDISPTAQLYLTLSNLYHIRILPSNRHVNSIQSHTAHARPYLKAAATLTAPAVEQCCKSNRIELSRMEAHVLAPDPSEVARDTATAYAKSITISKTP